MNATATTWSVEIQLGEREGHTHADVALRTGVEPPLHATGEAQLSERDRLDVPEIGYELATARALRALADVLMTTAREDVEAVTGDGDVRHADRPGGAW